MRLFFDRDLVWGRHRCADLREQKTEEAAMSDLTIEEIETAIMIVAYGMKRHSMPQALPVLKRFEAELERRRAEGSAMDYADRVLERYTKTVSANDNQRPKRLAG